jgi:flagellar biosynthetic protein FliR
MTVNVEIAWIVAVALVAIRFGAVLVLTPIFGSGSLPGHVRVFFIVGLSAVMVSGLSIAPASLPTSLPAFAAAALSELLLGALLAFGIFTAFAAFLLAGRIMDVQLGFGVASLIDPMNRTQSPLLGTILNLTAVAVFFALDGHHLLLRGLVFTLEQVPPGTIVSDINTAAVVAQFGAMFAYAVALSAPVIFVILLIDIVGAVIARSMPQVNVFIVSLPLKILVGLATLAISLRYLGPVMTRVFEGIFDYWQRLLS